MVFLSKDGVASILEAGNVAAPNMTQTRLICTLGPSSCEVPVLEELLKTGMKAVRFDLSWATPEWCRSTAANLRTAEANTGTVCAVILETSGPELQVLNVQPSTPVDFKAGATVTITGESDAPFTTSHVSINYAYSLADTDLCVGSHICIDRYLATGDEDTTLDLVVDSMSAEGLVCTVQNECSLGGPGNDILKCHIANVELDMPALSPRDREIIPQLQGLEFDFLGLAFTRSASDIAEGRKFLDENAMGGVKLIAKIESTEGLLEYQKILDACDAVIVSRGSLGVDLPAEKVFRAQKMLIKAANMAGKTVILTRVVDSMVHAPRPTRAEATDVANLCLDGADGILLGVESFDGVDPVQAAYTVLTICVQAEQHFNSIAWYNTLMDTLGGFAEAKLDKSEALASSAVRATNKLDAKMIITFTITGRTPRLLSKYRSSVPILSVVCESQLQSSDFRNIADLKSHEYEGTKDDTQAKGGERIPCSQIARQANLLRGVIPIMADPQSLGTTKGSMTDYALSVAEAKGLVKKGDRVVVSQCPRHNEQGQFIEAGIIKFVVVGETIDSLSSKGSLYDISDLVNA